MKWYRYLLASLLTILMIVGLIEIFVNLGIYATVSIWYIFPAFMLSGMTVQVNKTSNAKRGKLFWVLQALFCLGVIINLVSTLVETNIFIAISLFTLSVLLVVPTIVKTGMIEKNVLI